MSISLIAIVFDEDLPSSETLVLLVMADHADDRQRSGAQLIGRCPFHADKTPSLVVNPRKGVFCCHGCQAGGDVFSFAQRLLNSTFPDGVRLLARHAGIKLDNFRPSPEIKTASEVRGVYRYILCKFLPEETAKANTGEQLREKPTTGLEFWDAVHE